MCEMLSLSATDASSEAPELPELFATAGANPKRAHLLDN